MKRGDLFWVEFPDPIGKRPVVLVSRNEAYAVRKNIIVVEVTTRIRHMAAEVKIPPAAGVQKNCVANTDQIHTIPKTLLGRKIGALDAHSVRRLDDALRFALEVEPI